MSCSPASVMRWNSVLNILNFLKFTDSFWLILSWRVIKSEEKDMLDALNLPIDQKGNVTGHCLERVPLGLCGWCSYLKDRHWDTVITVRKVEIKVPSIESIKFISYLFSSKSFLWCGISFKQKNNKNQWGREEYFRLTSRDWTHNSALNRACFALEENQSLVSRTQVLSLKVSCHSSSAELSALNSRAPALTCIQHITF